METRVHFVDNVRNQGINVNVISGATENKELFNNMNSQIEIKHNTYISLKRLFVLLFTYIIITEYKTNVSSIYNNNILKYQNDTN